MPNNGPFHIICCLLLLLIGSSCLHQQASADISEISSASTIDNLQQQQQQISSNENDEDYMPQKENVLEKSYHGLIRENETLVEITPLIKVDEEKICSLRILKKPYHEMPFEIEMYNNLGILKAHHALNCEKRKNYHFELVAVFCDGLLSAPANVHITVVDINEYAPVFMQNEYVTEIDEGFLYKDIIRIEAIDKDCTPLYGDICKYEIINKDQQLLFTIDNDGSIRNLKPLSYKLAHNHILNVVAYDCAMKQSAPIMVNIKVRSLCLPQINGIPDHINYIHQSSKGQVLFPNAALELCDMQCDAQNMNIHTSIVLETNHISLGCDREILNCTNNNPNSNNNSNKNINNNNNTKMIKKEQIMIDLLERNSKWTKNLKKYVNDDENEEPIYHFDGNTGVLIPENIMTQHDFATQPFSIVTVFRHAPLQHKQQQQQQQEQFTTNNDKIENNNDIKHIKEHILCSADDHKMNRHHMALFVRNCRLILLLRKNFNDGDLNIFSPAEWRWKIPQVCDNQWHHYVINVINNNNNDNNNNNNNNNNDDINNNNNNNNGNIKIDLYIDGILFNKKNLKNNDDRHNNPEVIDDWPLHAAQGINTKLSVGACYQSSLKKLMHTFVGDISTVKISINGVLNINNIKCLTNCAEHFLLPNELINGNYLTSTFTQINDKLNEIYIETKSYNDNHAKDNIIKLLKQINYVNNKKQPTSGHRNIEIRTTIMCENQTNGNANSAGIIRLPTVKTSINIMNTTTTTTTTIAKLTTSSPFIMMAADNDNISVSLDEEQDDDPTSAVQPNDDNNDDNDNDDDDDDDDTTKTKNIDKIVIFGMANKLVSYAEIKQGVRILSDVNLTIINNKQQQQMKKNDEQDEEDKNGIYINSCSVVVFPSLNPDHEDINILNDDMLTNNLNIKTNINKEGVKMLGHDTIKNYMNILHALIYSNKKPAYYLNRVFKLTCHHHNEKLNKNHNNMKKYLKHQQQQYSGEYTLTLTVLHPKQQQTNNILSSQSSSSSLSSGIMSTSSPMMMSSKTAVASMLNNDDRQDAVFSHAMINSHAAEETQAQLHSIIHKTESTHSTMLIALICIFVAILLCGIYVARMRNNKIIRHQPCPKQIVDDSLAWDDSALTITINPMQSDAISDASCSESENSDTDDEEVLKARFSNVNQLEWDNSNIFTSAIN